MRCSTITPLAHSMPGAGVVHHIIRDCVEPGASLGMVRYPAESGTAFRLTLQSEYPNAMQQERTR
jgi:hypothetical protein